MRFLGLDPGIRCTGWGVIDVEGNRLTHVGDGVVRLDGGAPLGTRLACLYDGLCEVIGEYAPEEAAVEETFVNHNPASTLKLGLARGVVLLAPAQAGLVIGEYSANLIKKAIVGNGHATKDQVTMMVRTLLPGAKLETADAADALAVAVCHAHHRATAMRWAEAAKEEAPA
ncbi:MAG: crossover junction endodeoxyribonuclease RuvC [Alphaproteobacteria bacterium]